MYYSPILFSKIADLNLTQYHDCHIDMNYLNSKDYIIIFCLHSMGYLDKLYDFFDLFEKPFILISAMEDTQLPLEINEQFMEKITNNKYFKHWFSVNKTIPNDLKFTSIPYGLNYWSVTTRSYFNEPIQTFEEQDSLFKNICNNTVNYKERIPKIFCNFHFNRTDERHGDWRGKLPSILPNNITYYQPYFLSRRDSYEIMKQYSFVLSPFGHGFDCIRTFEALCLGCIVIMKKSFLDIIYEDLPILLVDEWTDINEELLNKTLIEFNNKQFNYNKLKMDYWINLVKSKF